MPVSAYILIVSNSEEQRITDCLEQSGYAFGMCTAETFSEKVIEDGSYDLVLKVTSEKKPGSGDIELTKFLNLPVPMLIVGPNPLPAKYHSIPTEFSDLELQKRIGSLARLQIMQRELDRRSHTTSLYRHHEEGAMPPLPKQDNAKIILLSQKSETLGEVLLQLDSKSKVLVCQNTDTVIDELRAEQYDALIAVGVGQGDVNLRLCNDIRADSRLFNLPILFVLENENNREAAYIHGASDIVISPAELPNLYTRAALHIQQADFRFSLQKLFKASKPLPVTDGPTGLYSYGFMMAHMASLMEDHSREGKFLSVATLTVSNLPEINEVYGYPAGDLVLRQIGSIISFLVRGEDFCCRHKGGHFLIALPSTSIKAARIALNRVFGVIRNTDFAVVGSDDPVSAIVEMGLAEMYPNDTLEQMIDRGISESKL